MDNSCIRLNEVINTIDHFKIFYENAVNIGKLLAFEQYYIKYKFLFHLMFKNLYMINYDSFKNIIENTNFNIILDKVSHIDCNII